MKAGDKVKVLSSPYDFVRQGDIGTLRIVEDHPYGYTITFDGFYDYLFSKEEIEAYEEPST